MMIDHPEPKKDTEPKPEPNYLKDIAEHLRSIRSMLVFFTVLAVVAIIFQACSILT